jgi:hypothetical protein
VVPVAILAFLPAPRASISSPFFLLHNYTEVLKLVLAAREDSNGKGAWAANKGLLSRPSSARSQELKNTNCERASSDDAIGDKRAYESLLFSDDEKTVSPSLRLS